jgi:hypothetical protein
MAVSVSGISPVVHLPLILGMLPKLESGLFAGQARLSVTPQLPLA